MLVQTQQGIKDVKVDNVTPENYIVPKGEEHKYHVILEVKAFDPADGKKRSVPRIQKIGHKTYESKLYPQFVRQGYNIIVLHNPNDWIAENVNHTEQLKQAKADAIKAKQDEAEAKRLEAEAKNISTAVNEALEAQEDEFQKRLNSALENQQKSMTSSIQDAVSKQVAAAIEAERKKVTDAKAASSSADPKPEPKAENDKGTKGDDKAK